jgi:hypothetical protein
LVAFELFKIRKILVEPRINIRQKLSDQFALKLENSKSIDYSNSGFEDDFRCRKNAGF